MSGISLLSVREAAAVLAVTPMAIRRRIDAGSLPAKKYGREWLLDRKDVERSARLRSKPGRAMSAPMAWSVLSLASGEPEQAAALAGCDRYWSRAQSWLENHSLVDEAPRLRGRAVNESFDVHRSELPRLLSRRDVLPTGVSAAKTVGLIGGPEEAEFYAPARARKELTLEHGLAPSSGAVRIRWVPDEVWKILVSNRRAAVPRAAVLVDLLESDDPRARREAAKALAR